MKWALILLVIVIQSNCVVAISSEARRFKLKFGLRT